MGWSFDPNSGRNTGSSGAGGFLFLLLVLAAIVVVSTPT